MLALASSQHKHGRLHLVKCNTELLIRRPKAASSTCAWIIQQAETRVRHGAVSGLRSSWAPDRPCAWTPRIESQPWLMLPVIVLAT